MIMFASSHDTSWSSLLPPRVWMELLSTTKISAGTKKLILTKCKTNSKKRSESTDSLNTSASHAFGFFKAISQNIVPISTVCIHFVVRNMPIYYISSNCSIDIYFFQRFLIRKDNPLVVVDLVSTFKLSLNSLFISLETKCANKQ